MMKKTELSKLDLTVYSETLDNGLRVFVVPFKNVNNIYATFTTNFGSNQTSFVPIDGNKMIKVPDGIAHFLEHKMFEQKDGKDPFSFYSERGADANANTNQYKTTYLFMGTNFFEDNLNYLLDYVQEPYFTDKNVEKEKGIIEQEMKMYQDQPYSVIFEKMTSNMFSKHPIRIPIIGTYKSIYSTTKDALYNCYNTFYHPSNMFVTVTGNVNPEEVIEIVRKNQEDKHFSKPKEIKVKEYKEPNCVYKEHDSIKMNVSIPKVGVGFKLDLSKIDLPMKKIISYISLFIDIKYDSTSIINEQLKNEGIINDELYNSMLFADKYLGIFIVAESEQPDKLISRIKQVINDKNIDKNDFERKIKANIAALISSSDSIYSINNKIMSNIIRYNKVIGNDYEIFRELNVDEMRKVIKKIDFSNCLDYVINSK